MFELRHVIEQLKQNHPYAPHPEKRDDGVMVVGYGREIEEKGINSSEAEFMLLEEVKEIIRELDESFKWFENLPDKFQGALIELCMLYGTKRIKSWKAVIEFDGGLGLATFLLSLCDIDKNHISILRRLARVLSGGKVG
jgi:hypothetical protein